MLGILQPVSFHSPPIDIVTYRWVPTVKYPSNSQFDVIDSAYNEYDRQYPNYRQRQPHIAKDSVSKEPNNYYTGFIFEL